MIPNSRNLNFSSADVKSYYGSQLVHFIPDGVNFWWNDEGETQYFTFADWNDAQSSMLSSEAPSRRFFSINRAFTPGMQKTAATVWSGDIYWSWEALQFQAGYQLNWMMSGLGYFTCDIGGFDGDGDTPPDLLVRWYQLGIFIGIMRVHSSINRTPHFPFLYDKVYADAMRDSLNLRYQLVPFLYSLAHTQYFDNIPIFRPLFFEFPDDSYTFDLSTEWLVGSNLLVAPVMVNSSSVIVYLPEGNWYDINTGTGVQSGPLNITLNVSLTTIPMFARLGAIIPMASVVQYTDAWIGATLDIYVYAGAAGQFSLVEDDGETTGYATDTPTKTRTTIFTYSGSFSVNWVVMGSYSDEHTFKTFNINIELPSGRRIKSDSFQAGINGYFSFAGLASAEELLVSNFK